MAASLGVGAGARGLMGLYNLMQGKPKSNFSPGPGILRIPYSEEEESLQKAGDGDSFMQGGSASSFSGIPWALPAATAGGLASLYGGWKGMDLILDAQRKRKLKQELERAKAEFEQALVPPPEDKQGSNDSRSKLGEDLDFVYDRMMKAAEPGFLGVDWGDLGGKAVGGYGVYALLSSLLAGMGAYGMTANRSRRKLLEKAQKRRAMQRAQQRPTEIFAIPAPIAPKPQRRLTYNQKDEEPES